jgi:hypothetical protein
MPPYNLALEEPLKVVVPAVLAPTLTLKVVEDVVPAVM